MLTGFLDRISSRMPRAKSPLVESLNNYPHQRAYRTDASEMHQPVQPLGKNEPSWVLPLKPGEVMVPRDDSYRGQPNPSFGKINLHDYAQQPYKQKLDIAAINARRAKHGKLAPIPEWGYIVPGEDPGARYYDSAVGEARPVISDSHVYMKRPDYAWESPMTLAGDLGRDIHYGDRNGYPKDPEQRYQAARKQVRATQYENGITEDVRFSPEAIAGHELNHLTNQPPMGTPSTPWDAKVAPQHGFTPDVYAGMYPAEALQVLAAFKRYNHAHDNPIETPEEFRAEMTRFAQLDPSQIPNKAEPMRMRNYLRKSVESYDAKFGNDPKVRKLYPNYVPGKYEGHPVFQNIVDKYRVEIPDLVQSRKTGQPMSKIAAVIARFRESSQALLDT